MRRILVCAAVLAFLTAAPSLANAGPGGARGGPKAGAKAGGAKPQKATAPKVAGPKGSGPKANAVAGRAATAPGKATAPGQVKRGTAPTPGATGAPQVAGAPAAAGPNVPRNPKLQARLQAMLPPGMTLEEAAAGYKNQGQFVASVRVANNLGIPFEDLKFQVVDQQSSLGQAIQTLKPGADASLEAQRAETQARQDLEP